MSNNSGITYYKLTEGYSGDRLKNCGLTGIEIDSNFYFLRGYDIESFKYDYNENVLKIERVNGDIFELKNIGSAINVEDSYYDAQNGVFHLSINGIDTPFSGFTIDNDTKEIKVLSDSSINGNGSKERPLSVSETLKTGFYAPVERFIDTTLENNTLPTSGVEYGKRILTKESISNYGYLYNFNSVKEIEDYLKSEGSQWRIPSNEEWGEMLNAVEICDSDRTHNLNTLSNADLGKYAGAILKSDNDEWEFSEDVVTKESFSKKLGFNVLPAGTPNPLRLDNNDLFGLCTGFWSNTEVTNSDVFVRLFEFNKDTVRLQAERNDGYFSLRLVKDIDLGVKPIEIIGNLPYSTVLMPYVKLNENGAILEEGVRAWTEQNISLPVFNPDSNFIPVEKDTNVNFKYFINYWNGEAWEKREFINNDMVIIGTGPDGTLNEEWQLIDGILYRRAKEIIDELHSFVEEEALIRENSDKDIINKINEEVGKINENIANVSSNLNKEINNRIENETAINARIDSVIEETEAGFNTINERITQETVSIKQIINDNKNTVDEALTSLENDISTLNTTLIKANDTINSRIDDVITETETSFNEVNTKIEKEVNDRIESENVINSRIDGVINETETKFISLNENLETEKNTRFENDNKLQVLINEEIINREESYQIISEKVIEEVARLDGLIINERNISENEKTEIDGKIDLLNNDVKYINSDIATINQDIKTIEENIDNLDNKINEEVLRAKDAENNLQASLDKETNRALATENEIKNLIGEGYTNLSITHKINENEAKIENLSKRINTNDSNIKEVEEKLNAFFNDAEISGQTVDTLVEIQEYINRDSGATAQLILNVSNAQNTADNAIERLDKLDYDNLYETDTYVSEVSQKNGLIEVKRLKFSDINDIITIKNDIKEINSSLTILDLSTKNTINELEAQINTSNESVSKDLTNLNEKINTLENKITKLENILIKLLGVEELPSEETGITPYINNIDTNIYLVDGEEESKLDIKFSENENGIGQKVNIDIKSLTELANIDGE